MARKGCFLNDYQITRIVALLAETDMTIFEIAQRMSCSRSVIGAINRKFHVRKYDGRRSTWSPASSFLSERNASVF